MVGRAKLDLEQDQRRILRRLQKMHHFRAFVSTGEGRGRYSRLKACVESRKFGIVVCALTLQSWQPIVGFSSSPTLPILSIRPTDGLAVQRPPCRDGHCIIVLRWNQVSPSI